MKELKQVTIPLLFFWGVRIGIAIVVINYVGGAVSGVITGMADALPN